MAKKDAEATQPEEAVDAETQPVVDAPVESEPEPQPEPEPESTPAPPREPKFTREQLLRSHRRFGLSGGTMFIVLKRLKGGKKAMFTRADIQQVVDQYRAES